MSSSLDFRPFPFHLRNTVRTLHKRFVQDQLGMTASSLTFTTLLALVPFFTVLLSVFTAFPSFDALRLSLQEWLIASLIPAEIADQVMDYLLQFASKASQMGAIGLGFLLGTVISLVMTVDQTLNRIWRVQRLRPLGQRLLIYWSMLTLGPLLLAASLATTSYLVSASKGWVHGLPSGVQLAFQSAELFVLALAMSALYHFVPNTPVKWRHAWAGGLFAAAGFALAKKGLGLYLSTVPTYSLIYGTFATLPILLIWLYVCWTVVLLGAVVAAYLPSLPTGVSRQMDHPGWRCELALEIIAALAPLRQQPQRGISATQLARMLGVDRVQLEPPLSALAALRWVGAMPETGTAYLEEGEPLYVLLADPHTTPIAALLQHTLLTPSGGTLLLWQRAGWDSALLIDALPPAAAQPPQPTPKPTNDLSRV